MAWLNSWGTGKYEALDDLALAPEKHKEIFGEGFVNPEEIQEKRGKKNYEAAKK